MAYRQNIGVGGLYPTGRAPLSLDLATPSRAITERIIQREQEKIQQEKDYMNESQKAIMEALSWQAVKGASEKMQLLHLENMREVQDKWADIYADNGGKLSDKQRLELLKAKQNVEAERTNMQTNVKEFELVQQAIINDPDQEVYGKETHDAFNQAVQQGWAGDPTKSWIDILKPKPVDTFTALTKPDMQSLVKSVVSNIDVEGWRENPDGSYSWNETNKRAIDNAFGTFLASKRGQNVFRYYGGDEAAVQRIRNEFEQAVIRDVKNRKESSALITAQNKGRMAQNLSDPVKKALARNNMDASYVDPDTPDNIVQMNDMSVLVSNMDKDGIKALESRYIPGLDGNPEKVGVQYRENDARIVLLRGKKRKDITFPKSYPDDVLKKEYLLGAFGDAASSAKVYAGGKQVPDNVTRYMYPDWKVDKKIEPAMPIGYDEFKEKLGDLDIKAREIYNLIKDEALGMLPDADVELKGKYIQFNGEKYQVSTKFNGDAKSGRKDLKAAVDAEIKRHQDEFIGTAQEGGEMVVSPDVNISQEQQSVPDPEFAPSSITDEKLKTYEPATRTEIINKKRDEVLSSFGSYDEALNSTVILIKEKDPSKSSDAALSNAKKILDNLGISKSSFQVTAPDVNIDQESSEVPSPDIVEPPDEKLKTVTPKVKPPERNRIDSPIKLKDAPEINSDTARTFKQKVGDVIYSQEKRFEKGYEDCSSAVCKVFNIPNTKDSAVSAQDIYYGGYTKNKRAVKDIEKYIETAKDGDILFMDAEAGKKKIDHVAVVAVDKDTNEKYLLEVVGGKRKGSYITPFEQRVKELIGASYWVAEFAK